MLHFLYIYAAKRNELENNVKKYSVLIPTSSHLKKFLSVEYGHPVKIDNKTLIGTVIISMLQKQNFHVALKPVQKVQQVDGFTTSLSCVAPMSVMKDYGHSITADQAIQLNRFFEKFFYEKLYLFVQHRINKDKRKLGVQDAIFEFCSHYDIELDSDISYDSLKKSEWRWRKNQNKIFRAFVPSRV